MRSQCLQIITVCILAIRVGYAADKYALLVGVSEYSHSRMNDTLLQYPEADARAVGDALQASGYTVITLLGQEATKEAIDEQLEKLAGQGSSGGVALIGVFGHGVHYGNDAYFGPFDTGIRFVTDDDGKRLRNKDGSATLEPNPTTMTPMRSILNALSACGAQTEFCWRTVAEKIPVRLGVARSAVS